MHSDCDGSDDVSDIKMEWIQPEVSYFTYFRNQVQDLSSSCCLLSWLEDFSQLKKGSDEESFELNNGKDCSLYDEAGANLGQASYYSPPTKRLRLSLGADTSCCEPDWSFSMETPMKNLDKDFLEDIQKPKDLKCDISHLASITMEPEESEVSLVDVEFSCQFEPEELTLDSKLKSCSCQKHIPDLKFLIYRSCSQCVFIEKFYNQVLPLHSSKIDLESWLTSDKTSDNATKVFVDENILTQSVTTDMLVNELCNLDEKPVIPFMRESQTFLDSEISSSVMQSMVEVMDFSTPFFSIKDGSSSASCYNRTVLSEETTGTEEFISTYENNMLVQDEKKIIAATGITNPAFDISILRTAKADGRSCTGYALLSENKQMSEVPSVENGVKFVSFNSAGGEKVNVSEKMFRKAENIQSEEYQKISKVANPVSGRPAELTNNEIEFNDASELSVNLLLLGEQRNDSSDSKKIFVGFQTAAGQRVTISKNNFQKVQKMWKDNDVTENENLGNCFEELPANSLKSKILTEFLPQAQVVKQDVENADDIASSLSNICTASVENALAVSEDMNNAEQIKLAAVDENNKDDIEKIERAVSPNFKCDCVSETSNKVKFQKCLAERTLPEKINICTGSDKMVVESMEITAPLLKTDSLVANDTRDNTCEYLMESGDCSPKPAKVGFCTRSGKMATVSRKSLELARSLFDTGDTPLKECHNNISALNMESGESLPVVGKIGFCTGSGKTATVSRKSLDAARSLFNQDVVLDENYSDTDMLDLDSVDKGPKKIGFCTGSGKRATVSRKSLEAARSFFNQEDKNYSGRGKSNLDLVEKGSAKVGFSTVSGKRAVVTRKSLEAARSLFNQDVFDQNYGTEVLNAVPIEKKSEKIGFCTGSGKKSTVSRKSLDLARSLFDAKTSLFKDSCSDNLINCAKLEDAALQSEFCTTSRKKSTLSSNRMKKATLLPDDMKDGKDTTVQCNVEVTGANCLNSSNTSFCSNIVLNEKLPLCTLDVRGENPTENILKDICNITHHVSEQKALTSNLSKKEGLKNGVRAPKSFNTPFKENQDLQKDLKRPQQISCIKKAVVPGMLWNVRHNSQSQRLKFQDAVSGKPPMAYSLDELISSGVRESTIQVNSCNAGSFRFESSCFDGQDGITVGDGAFLNAGFDGQAGKEEFYSAFVGSHGVDSSLICEKWFSNHYRWIIWKLAAMEVAFPKEFGSRCLLPDQLMLQIKYRYDREIDHSQRSALCKILERDDSSTKMMVLCVSQIRDDGKGVLLEVTDGWYSVLATGDSALNNLVCKGTIQVGQKLVVANAELIGSEIACHPLEAPEGLRLKLWANSTRRARWHAKLGFIHTRKMLEIPLASVMPDGGIIGCIICLIHRVYPLQFLEKFASGSFTVRNSYGEEKAASNHEKTRSMCIETITERVLQEKNKKCAAAASRRKSMRVRAHLSTLASGPELYEAMQAWNDDSSFQDYLTKHQMELLSSCLFDMDRNRTFDEINRAVATDSQFPQPREVVTLLKIRISGISEGQSALLTIWRPTEDLISLMQEGKCFKICNLFPRRSRNRESGLELNSTKNTRYQLVDIAEELIGKIYISRKVTPLGSTEYISELDVLGLIFHLSDQDSTFQSIYLTDPHLNILCIRIWRSMQRLCSEEVLKVGNVVCFSNLQARISSWPQTVYANETTIITLKPEFQHLKTAFHNFPKLDISALVEAAGRLIHQQPSLAAVKKVAVQPMHYPSYSPSYELGMNQECTTPLGARMARLERYGSASPLPPLVSSSSPLTSREFKPPRCMGNRRLIN